MIQVKLSKILQKSLDYEDLAGQLYYRTEDGPQWFDMILITPQHKLYFFLYLLQRYAYSRQLFVGYEPIFIINDIQDPSEDGALNVDTYYLIEPMLADYNIATSTYPEAHTHKRLAVIPLEEFIICSRQGEGLQTYCKQIKEYLNVPEDALEEWTPTDVFIDCPLGSKPKEYISAIHSLSTNGHTYNYLNAGFYAYQKDVRISAPTNVKYTCSTLDGWTLINGQYLWWAITHSPSSQYSYHILKSLYDYIVSLGAQNIYISSKGLGVGENTNATKGLTYIPTNDYDIPVQVLYLFALIHINTGKVFEFIDFHQRYFHSYLEIVQELAMRSLAELKDRIEAIEFIQTPGLYLLPNSNKVLPLGVNAKRINLNFKAVKLADVTKRIILIKNEYIITASITDTLPFDTWSQNQLDITKMHFLSILELLPELVDDSGNLQMQFHKAESYAYAILRLLEQKLLGFNAAKNLADIIVFEYNSERYIGFGKVDIHFDTTLYLCAGSIHGMPYTAQKIIPTSILIEENELSQSLADLLVDYPKTIVQPFTEEQTIAYILAWSTAFTNGELLNFANLASGNPVTFAMQVALYNYYNYGVRKSLWSELTQKVKAFGLRTLDVNTAPLTIYGGINTQSYGKATVSFYPVAFDNYPRRVLDE